MDTRTNMTGKKIGFIGTGKMGEALIRGILRSGLVPKNSIHASDKYFPALDKLSKELEINVSTDNDFTVLNSDIIILAVKPQILKSVLSEIRPSIDNKKLVISIAAGVRAADIENELESGTRVVRVMPNIAATVSEGASAISPGKNSTIEDTETAVDIFESVGSAIVISEGLMDAVTGLSGSGPAFIFPIIEAMADGAVYEGLDRQSALTLAAQTVLGAAKMMMVSRKHPGELKDMVTSPGGTTIRGVHTLEEYGVRAAFMNAVIESSKRSRELGKKEQ